jgi:hypothetical protein
LRRRKLGLLSKILATFRRLIWFPEETGAFKSNGTQNTANSSSILMPEVVCPFGFGIIGAVQSSMVTMKQRLLSFIVGHPGWLRNSIMMLMYLVRRRCPASQLLPDLLFIRTLRSPHHVVSDKKTGRYRISSKAFAPSTEDGALSGDLEQILKTDGLPATTMYPALSSAVGAAAITVGKIGEAGATVSHDPFLVNWYHGSVFGITDAVKRRLHKAATELIEIDQAEAARLDALWNAEQITLATQATLCIMLWQ